MNYGKYNFNLFKKITMQFYKNYTEIAKTLWISRPTLMKRIKEWEIKINKVKKEDKYFLTN